MVDKCEVLSQPVSGAQSTITRDWEKEAETRVQQTPMKDRRVERWKKAT
jgi:hypothetical protein